MAAIAGEQQKSAGHPFLASVKELIDKVNSGSPTEIEKVLNVLSQDGWRPVAMSCFGQPAVLTVILENKVMEEAKLNLPSTLGERAPTEGALRKTFNSGALATRSTAIAFLQADAWFLGVRRLQVVQAVAYFRKTAGGLFVATDSDSSVSSFSAASQSAKSLPG